MPTSIVLRASIVTLALLFVTAAPAAAQNIRDLSIGYSFLWLQDNDEAPGGWQVTYAREITPVMRWVADFGGHYGAEDSIHTFQGGLRFSLRRTEPVVPFVTAVAGAGYGVRDDDEEKGLAFTAQLGAGLDFVFRPDGPGLRVQADVPVFFVGDNPEESFRLTVGFVIAFK